MFSRKSVDLITSEIKQTENQVEKLEPTTESANYGKFTVRKTGARWPAFFSLITNFFF